MVKIGEVLVDEKIGRLNFECDLVACKGGCCTFPGELGAPVLDEEIERFKECFDASLEYLSKENIAYIENHGMIQGLPGSYSTMCIDKRACVFVFFEDDIAFCAFERAYLENKTKWRKPISCHLFPVREGSFGGKAIYYEKIKECKSALKKGRENGTPMYENIKDALIRRFGEDWFKELENKFGAS